MTTQDAAPVADQPDSLAVALALEMAAKVCEDVDNEYEEGRAYVAAERIRTLIPADIAAEAQKAREDAARLDMFESLAIIDECPYFFNREWWYLEKSYPTLRAAIDAAQGAK